VAVVVLVSRIAGGTAPTSGLLPSVIATALVAAAFAPVKERISRAARRLVYGVRATPYDALAALPRHLADVPAVADVLLSTADMLTRGLGVPAARVRVFLDGGGESVAWSPADGEAGTLIVVPVRHLGGVVGDVAVQPWTDRPLSNRQRRLLADLAAQAGPALRSVALATELQTRLDQITEQSALLRASRQRIVTAQIAERRRLERDLHDGAQQQLVALAMSIQNVEKQVAAGRPGAALIAALAECRAELGRCIDEVRLLAGGIYPPVLIARGLAAALRARARLGTSDVRVNASPAVDGARFPNEVELSVYFCCLEALQNAAKHAPGAHVWVRLEVTDTALTFEVTDDGPGLDPQTVRASGGSGLLGMEDRVGVVGGTLVIDGAPGRGCTVRGTVPLPFVP
jgi:signal transduction histidine kinase